MPSIAEESVSTFLHMITEDVPDGGSVRESEHLQNLLDGLEYYLPEVLRRTYLEWEHESLDGFYPLVVRKAGDAGIELFGLAIIITDQTTTPIHVFIQADVAGHEVTWLALQLGEKGEEGMVRNPWQTKIRTDKLVNSLDGRLGTFEWVYEVGFGTKRI